MDFSSNADSDKNLHFILEHFLNEDLCDVNNIYFEKLIKYLSHKDNSHLLQNNVVINTLDRCIQHLETNYKRIHPKVYAFMLNLCSLMVKNEWILVEMREKRIIDRLLLLIEKYGTQFTPSIKLGYIRVLRSISGISFGLSYIRLHPEAWRYPIKLCTSDHTIYVIREAHDLIFELLYNYSVKAKDEQLVLEILEEIIQPIQKNTFNESEAIGNCNENMDIYPAKVNLKDKCNANNTVTNNHKTIMINVDDNETQSKVSPTLDLLSYIFEQSLTVTNGTTNISSLCHEKYKLEILIWKLVEMTQNHIFVGKILKTLTTLNFARLICEQMDQTTIKPEKFNHFGLNFFNTMKFCVNRNELLNFLQLAQLNHILWKKIASHVPKKIKIDDEYVSFENQLITFHLLPVLFTLHCKKFYESEIFDHYLMKLFEINSQHTLRICYAFRDTLMDSTSCDKKTVDLTKFADLAYKSINGILSMEKILDREQAILVFQAMMYALKTFIDQTMMKIESDSTTLPNQSMSSNNSDFVVLVPNVLYSMLIGLRSLIERYNITWKESLETICLVNMVGCILKNSNLTEKLAVQALKLLQLSIEHFLSPNMALLVDKLDDFTFVPLGPIIVKRLHDLNWEVRDSALELLTSIADISYCKFPALQAFLQTFKFCTIVWNMVEHDSEIYVVASALKCLMKMYKLQNVWDINEEKFIPYLFNLLHKNGEGIICKEALKMLKIIQEKPGIPSKYEGFIFSTIANCLLNKFHWEVKIEALHFCEFEIHKQFNDQGMLDGTFPNVTFSKETKKIVTLTKSEINLRITRVLKEMSRRGYLGMLLSCLKEENDFEVRKEAIYLTQRLMEILNNNDYERYLKELSKTISISKNSSLTNQALSDKEKLSVTKQDESGTSPVDKNYDTVESEKTIEHILNIGDINLVNNIYASNLFAHNFANLESNSESNNQHNNCEEFNQYLYKKYTKIGPTEFIDEISKINLTQLLSNNEQQMENFDNFKSLLEDIIALLQQKDANGILNDCY